MIRNAGLGGKTQMDVRLDGGTIADVGSCLTSRPGEPVLDAAGHRLVPGLHDNHIHLRAAAAAAASVRVGPETVRDSMAFAALLAGAPTGSDGWVRGVGYHDSVAGELDRWKLDAIEAVRPVRIQHRSGAQWIVNSAGARLLDLQGSSEANIGRGNGGMPDGRLFRMDDWLGDRIGRTPPDLGRLSRELAARGITGVTEATPKMNPAEIADLRGLVSNGTILQRVHCMAPAETPTDLVGPRFTLGPVKLVLDDANLPTQDELADAVRAAHDAGRPVAVHCVTAVQLVFLISVLRREGRKGDRVEHAAVVPDALIPEIRELGLGVVSQPVLVAERGDQYLAEVEDRELGDLWRLGSLLEAGVSVVGGSDAPYGSPDPWRSIDAAMHRLTPSGATLGAEERIGFDRALALFWNRWDDPGRMRRIAPGQPADLCLLEEIAGGAPHETLRHGAVATIVDGHPVHGGELFSRL